MALRPRRAAAALTATERAWAQGEPIATEDVGELQFFTPVERLDAAFQAVRGQTLAAWLLATPDLWSAGAVEFNGVRVFWLHAADLAGLAAGCPVAPQV
jgi:hypothetical protein